MEINNYMIIKKSENKMSNDIKNKYNLLIIDDIFQYYFYTKYFSNNYEEFLEFPEEEKINFLIELYLNVNKDEMILSKKNNKTIKNQINEYYLINKENIYDINIIS